MPRKGRGGRREGTEGQAYPNRADLNSSNPAPGTAGHMGTARPYDTGTQLPSPAGTQGPAGLPQGPPAPPPGSLTPLNAPSQRPHEPLTAGLSGPGNTILPEDPDEMIRVLYRLYPSEPLRRLVERLPVRVGSEPDLPLKTFGLQSMSTAMSDQGVGETPLPETGPLSPEGDEPIQVPEMPQTPDSGNAAVGY